MRDDKGAWMGRSRYSRRRPSQNMLGNGYGGDWKCSIMVPQEHAVALLAQWRDMWSEQRQKQVELTDVEERAAADAGAKGDQAARRFTAVLTRARPEWETGKVEGIEEWKASFAWEFPWPTDFVEVAADDPLRTQSTALRSVAELVTKMAAESQATFTAAEDGDCGNIFRDPAVDPTIADSQPSQPSQPHSQAEAAAQQR